MTLARHELEIKISPHSRGVANIDSSNRVAVRKWLGTFGVPYAVAGLLTIEELRRAYRDDSDETARRYIGCTGDRTYITVPYADKDRAKLRGAKWDKTHNLWYFFTGDAHKDDFAAWEQTGRPPQPVPATPAPAPAPAAPATNDVAAAIAAAIAAALAGLQTGAGTDEAAVIALIAKHSRHLTVTIETKEPQPPRTLPDEARHAVFADVLRLVARNVNIFLVGPAGCGKTTLAEQVARALGLDFYFTGAISSEYKLSGFIDAQGRIVSTPFRNAYQNGGLFLFDEIDGSLPGAVMSFNAALANGHADFPDKNICRHADFRVIGAANTFGAGADRLYVGRNQLDASTLDRFFMLPMAYDDDLEAAIVGDRDTYGWLDRVRAVRRAVATLKLRHIVSPRSTLHGLTALEAGVSRKTVEAGTIFKSLDKPTIRKIEAEVIK